MRTKVETKDIFGSTSAVDNQAAASTEVKETKKTAKKATEKKPVKEAAVKKTEDIAAKLSEVKSDLEEKRGEVKAETAKKKPGRKPAAKKTTASTKTTAAKKAAEAKKETTAKSAAKTTRKTAAKKTFKKELFFQFDGKQVDEETLVARITEDVKSQNVEIKDLKMYLKPEDNACYYVANGNLAGKVDLY